MKDFFIGFIITLMGILLGYYIAHARDRINHDHQGRAVKYVESPDRPTGGVCGPDEDDARPDADFQPRGFQVSHQRS